MVGISISLRLVARLDVFCSKKRNQEIGGIEIKMKPEDIKLLNLYYKSLEKWHEAIKQYRLRRHLGLVELNKFIYKNYCQTGCSFCYDLKYISCNSCLVNPDICADDGSVGLFRFGYRLINSKVGFEFWLVFMCIALRREIKKLEESKILVEVKESG